MTQNTSHILNKLLMRPGGPHHFVFDIDSTLVHVHTRNHSILVDFIAQDEVRRKYPQSTKKFSSIEFLPSDWGLSETLQRHGLNNSDHEFFTDLKKYWEKSFFSNDFLHRDIPVLGAIEYVHETHNQGHRISYLTGRDEPKMLEGTLKSFKHLGFPLDQEGISLILKPHDKVSDEDFKKGVFDQLASSNQHIYFFENEPVNLNMAAKHFPNIELILINTTHSRREEPPEKAHIISHFKRD